MINSAIMEARLRRLFGQKRKRFSLQAEHANFDFRGKVQENGDKIFFSFGHQIYGSVLVYMLPIIIIFAIIFLF